MANQKLPTMKLKQTLPSRCVVVKPVAAVEPLAAAEPTLPLNVSDSGSSADEIVAAWPSVFLMGFQHDVCVWFLNHRFCRLFYCEYMSKTFT
jgi:hypothetical protein